MGLLLDTIRMQQIQTTGVGRGCGNEVNPDLSPPRFTAEDSETFGVLLEARTLASFLRLVLNSVWTGRAPESNAVCRMKVPADMRVSVANTARLPEHSEMICRIVRAGTTRSSLKLDAVVKRSKKCKTRLCLSSCC
jgi:hypothetical protein